MDLFVESERFATSRAKAYKLARLNARALSRAMAKELQIAYLLGSLNQAERMCAVYNEDQEADLGEFIGEVHIAIKEIQNRVCDLSGIPASEKMGLNAVIDMFVKPSS